MDRSAYDFKDPACAKCYYHWLHQNASRDSDACAGRDDKIVCTKYHPPLKSQYQHNNRVMLSLFLDSV